MDEAVVAKWEAYNPTFQEEVAVILEANDAKGTLYDQLGKRLMLTPSPRAIKHGKKMARKLAPVTDEELHPLIKRMTTSPYTWELVLRMHAGTIDARTAYKENKDLDTTTDTKDMQDAYKTTMAQLTLERKQKKYAKLTPEQQEALKKEATTKKQLAKIAAMSEEEKEAARAKVVASGHSVIKTESLDNPVENSPELWWDDWWTDDGGDDDDDWFDWWDDEDDGGDDDWFSFLDDWFGDDTVENLVDDNGIEDWDDAEYDAMPSISLHAGLSTQLLFALGTATVDIAVNTDLMYSVGATIGYGVSSDWYSMELEYTQSCTFMWDICDNPGDSISLGVAVGATGFGISVDMSVATIWSYDYEVLGIDFAFATGVDALLFSIDLAVQLLWCTTDMPFNARDMRSYCNPKEYTGAAEKEAPWAISNWSTDDDYFDGWNSLARIEKKPTPAFLKGSTPMQQCPITSRPSFQDMHTAITMEDFVITAPGKK